MNTIQKIQDNKRKVLIGLSAVIVFITAYLLIMPALTLDEEEAASQGGIDLAETEMISEAGLEYEGDGYTVTAHFDAKAGLPEDTSLTAAEIGEGDEDYDAWKAEALKALQETGKTSVSQLRFAKFYDISLLSDGSEIEPNAPVDVAIFYQDALKAKDDSKLRIIHFVASETGEPVPEILSEEAVTAVIDEGHLTQTAFTAESFSVYGVVYMDDPEVKAEEPQKVQTKKLQAKAAAGSRGGQVVQTIPNPQGTTMELFNYFVSEDTKTLAGRDQWPGHIHDDAEFWKFDWYDMDGNYAASWGEGWNRSEAWRNSHLLGYGNDIGINHGHAFKFTPANQGTVIDGSRGTKSSDDNGGINSWTGNGDPRQGIVQGVLSGGYPVMTNDRGLGSDGSSLAYLFDDSAQEGKESKGKVDHLLYVDEEGYYTYDSRKYMAEYQEDGTFRVSEQPNTDDTEVKGFWPFGEKVYWSGLHLNTQFSMPEGGQVLNPKDELKDMQFEFSGDDDTWLYIDGVLVGDGGGIHNRTEVDVNFATGKVLVTGKKDTVHTGSFEETRWLDDIFKEAGRYLDEEWEEIPGTGHKRFRAGTYHTFDMFYLERGGGESNLYIHYNLVSTDDFTAHKSYEGFAEGERMSRDQFHFQLIGLDGQYQSVWNEETHSAEVTKLNDDAHAIMPVKGSADGEGTFDDPKKVRSDSAWTDGEGHVLSGTVFTTGVSENGDIRFGTADISAEEMAACDGGHPSLYRYIVREVIPGDAVNADGISWSEATDAQRAAGGFVKDQVRYDSRTYYMTARVTSWEQEGSDGSVYTAYGLSKTYYTDDSFQTADEDVKFIDFRNRYAPDSGKAEFTKVDAAGQPLDGAEFTLYTNAACTKTAKNLDGEDQVKTSGSDGKVSFENMAAPRTYFMKETGAPRGYEPNDTVYRVAIESSRDSGRKSMITVDGDETGKGLEEIVNTKAGQIAVKKHWVDPSGKEISGGKRTAKVQLKRYKYVKDEGGAQSHHSITINFKSTSYSGQTRTDTRTETFEGDAVTVIWKVAGGSGPGAFSGWDSTGWDSGSQSTVFSRSFTDVKSDITLDVVLNEYWVVQDKGFSIDSFEVQGAGASEPAKSLVPDEEFPGASDDAATQTLTADNHWACAWKIGNGLGNDFPASNQDGEYLYYIVELDEDGNEVPIDGEMTEGVTLRSIAYEPGKADGAGIRQGLISVTNEVTEEESEPIEIMVTKYDKSDLTEIEADPIPGATFRLEKYESEEYRVKDESWEEQEIADEKESGMFRFRGLTEGFYKIVEVETPDGYVKLSEDPTFEVVKGKAGLEVVFSDTDMVMYTAEKGFRFGNEPGQALPNAGGRGTGRLYLLGTVLLLGCGLTLTVRRRMQESR